MPTFRAVVVTREARLREGVLDAESKRERVAGLRLEHVVQHDAVSLALDRRPRGPADEPVDRVSCSGSVSGSWSRLPPNS